MRLAGVFHLPHHLAHILPIEKAAGHFGVRIRIENRSCHVPQATDFRLFPLRLMHAARPRSPRVDSATIDQDAGDFGRRLGLGGELPELVKLGLPIPSGKQFVPDHLRQVGDQRVADGNPRQFPQVDLGTDEGCGFSAGPDDPLQHGRTAEPALNPQRDPLREKKPARIADRSPGVLGRRRPLPLW